MQRSSFADMHCSIARALEVVGEWWTLLIVRDALAGISRFDDFQASLGIARNVLAVRLRRLTDSGILERHRYQESPDRYEYRPTQKGRDLYPVLATLMHWGDTYEAHDRLGPPVALRHESCRHETHPVLACAHCGEEMTRDNTSSLSLRQPASAVTA